jgi:hypothetical protein
MLKTCCLVLTFLINIFNLGAQPQAVINNFDSQAKSFQNLAEFTGRFSDGKDYVVYFEETKYGLTIRPALWTATQLLGQSEKDRFLVVDRPSRSATFQRDGKGQVVGVTIQGMEGEGVRLNRVGSELLPVELLLAGKGQAASRAFLEKGTDVIKLLEIAERVLNGRPSMPKTVVGFLSEMASRFPSNDKLYTILGYAQVAAGDRKSAVVSLSRAYSINPDNKEAISGLARLKAPPSLIKESTAGWKLPFPLGSIFKEPTTAEIRAVENDWRTRDLNPRDVQEVFRGKISYGQSNFVVRIVSHRVHGFLHYGAILIPPDAKPSCCPIIVEAKGVSWNYFPLELEKLNAPRLMANLSERVIYVIPSFRGEVLLFEGNKYQSEGDRTDALDGATDDAIALLNAALKTTPEADANKICAFGHSRGGTVALLAGIRDKRFKCVVNWAGPTDWFNLMGTGGWSEQELYSEGLRTRANPSETGGQNIERFLLKAIRGEETLKTVRHRMLASSPLYFARRFRQVQLHYGEEDSSVPVRNGRKLVIELKRYRVPISSYEIYFYPGAGHDTDRIKAPVLTREYFIKFLWTKENKTVIGTSALPK